MSKLNLKGSGSRQRLTNRIRSLQLDISHWRYGSGKRRSYARSLETILTESSPHRNTWTLKCKLIKAGLLKNQCYIEACSLSPEWQGKLLTLQLDHINGDRTDNRLENLRILCPNCHSQTNTYAGRNQTGKPQKKPEEYIRHACQICGRLSTCKRTKICAKCRNETRSYAGCKVSMDQIHQIVKLFKQGVTKRELARKFDVSETLIRKLILRYTSLVGPEGLEPPTYELKARSSTD